MSDDEYLLGLREWLPITEPVVFGVDRRPCPPSGPAGQAILADAYSPGRRR